MPSAAISGTTFRGVWGRVRPRLHMPSAAAGSASLPATAMEGTQPSQLALPGWMKRTAGVPAEEPEPKAARGAGGALAKAKANGRGRGRGDKVPELTHLLGKLVLANSRELASLVSVVYKTYEMAADEPVVAAVIEAGREYDVESKRLRSEGLPMGGRLPPFIYAWVAVMKVLAGTPGAHQHSFAEYWRAYVEPAESEQTLGRHVVHCRFKKNRRAEGAPRGRLILALNPEFEAQVKIWGVLEQCLLERGAKLLVGPAPRGPLERDISRLLGEVEA